MKKNILKPAWVFAKTHGGVPLLVVGCSALSFLSGIIFGFERSIHELTKESVLPWDQDVEVENASE